MLFTKSSSRESPKPDPTISLGFLFQENIAPKINSWTLFEENTSYLNTGHPEQWLRTTIFITTTSSCRLTISLSASVLEPKLT